jgi:uncharacterized protein (TIGR02145 family)
MYKFEKQKDTFMKYLLLFGIMFCLCSIASFSQLRLTCPNGGEKFVIGSDSLITWEGIEKERRVKLEYSIDNGNTWFLISKKAFGYKYIWKNIPKPSSNKCLIKISTNLFPCPDVKIGKQIWTGCNLDVDYFRNGDSIPQITSQSDIRRNTLPVWCYANNDTALGAINGKYYNWLAVTDSLGLAPIDYHIPTRNEWTELVNYVGDSTNAGGKLKTTGTRENGDGLWASPNLGATNEYGFSALPSERITIMPDRISGYYSGTTFWSSTAYESAKKKLIPYAISLYSSITDISWNTWSSQLGMTIRCIRDSTAPPDQTDTSYSTFSIIAPQAQAYDIDMKKQLVGTPKDSLITDLVSNIGECKLLVDSIYFSGTDKDAFKLISDFPKYSLIPGESKSSHIEFTPNRIGLHTAKINIITQSDTLIRNIQGIGVGGILVTVKNDSAYAGDIRRLKLIMSGLKPEELASLAPNFSAKIRFQKTILTPLKKTERNVINDSTYMNISGKIPTTNDLGQLLVIAGLGTVEETTIDIVEFILTDDSGNKVDFNIKTQPGLFKLLGICREGGTRLINPTGKAEILSIIPNPASEDIDINVNLIEDGTTTLSIFNSNGLKVKELNISGETGMQTIKLDGRDYSNGLYFIQLQTPTVVANQKMMIIK